jgi:hypothetical protein
LKIELARQFETKDLSYLWYFLGIEVAYSPRGYLLSQSKYIADILERAKLTDNKTIDTFIEVNARYFFMMVYFWQILLYIILLLGAWYIS